MLTNDEIRNRVEYHAPSPEAILRHNAVRRAIEYAMIEINTNVPDSREKSVAMTELETAMFWANAGIARNHEKL